MSISFDISYSSKTGKIKFCVPNDAVSNPQYLSVNKNEHLCVRQVDRFRRFDTHPIKQTCPHGTLLFDMTYEEIKTFAKLCETHSFLILTKAEE